MRAGRSFGAPKTRRPRRHKKRGIPTRSLRPCGQPGCGALVRAGYCAAHQASDPKVQAERERPSAARRGYGHRWRKAAAGYLRLHPLCVACEAEGRVEVARVVDHIEPHRGDRALF